ncbi:MAG: GNAT family N-acetyltransferase [Candidatus Thermoplasmatota archaeon]|nr:GNAT family N-acetyltransferase [Candidatus Thermoplasmatota archaeon]
MYLKRFSPEDIIEVEELEKRTFEVGPYNREELEELLTMPDTFNFLLYDEKSHELLGYIAASKIDEVTANIESIAVDPRYQGKGAGTALLNAIEQEMKARKYIFSILEVREMNMGALEFYKSKGYEEGELLKNFYTLSYKGSNHGIRLIKKLT